MRMAAGLPAFDVMLEVRAKDLALTQLRDDLRRFRARAIWNARSGVEALAGRTCCPEKPAKASTPKVYLIIYD